MSIWTKDLKICLNKEKKTEASQYVEYTINAQQIIYVNCPKKTLKGDFTTSQGRLSGSPTLRSDGYWNCQAGGWISTEAAKGTQNLATSRGAIR
jgi:uncharacterized cupin superfamily protein